jgi:hypothetical protein
MQTKSSSFSVVTTAINCPVNLSIVKLQKGHDPEGQQQPVEEDIRSASKARSAGESEYNLEAVLHGEGNRGGHIHFRQDADATKIIHLDTKVHHLEPDHEYLIQRAVDAINVVDGNCTSTSWLTLGYGLTPHAILTDDNGNGVDILWRDVTTIPSGGMFDIHFR